MSTAFFRFCFFLSYSVIDDLRWGFDKYNNKGIRRKKKKRTNKTTIRIQCRYAGATAAGTRPGRTVRLKQRRRRQKINGFSVASPAPRTRTYMERTIVVKTQTSSAVTIKPRTYVLRRRAADDLVKIKNRKNKTKNAPKSDTVPCTGAYSRAAATKTRPTNDALCSAFRR